MGLDLPEFRAETLFVVLESLTDDSAVQVEIRKRRAAELPPIPQGAVPRKCFACLGAYDLVTLELGFGYAPGSRAQSQPTALGDQVIPVLLPEGLTEDIDALYEGFTSAHLQSVASPLEEGPPPTSQEPRDLFLAVVKIRLSPLLSVRMLDSHRDQLAAVIEISRTARAWVLKAAECRRALVGLALGWSEVVLLASSCQVAPLLGLVGLVRSIPARPRGEKGWGHLVAMTKTHLAHHSSLLVAPQVSEKGRRWFDHAMEVARRVRRCPSCRAWQPIAVTPYLRVFPGHDSSVAKILEEAVTALQEVPGHPVFPGRTEYPWLTRVGRHDMAGPAFRTSSRSPREPDGLPQPWDEVAVICLVGALRNLLRHSGPAVQNLLGCATNVSLFTDLKNESLEGHLPGVHRFAFPAVEKLSSYALAASTQIREELKSLSWPEYRLNEMEHVFSRLSAWLMDDTSWAEVLPLLRVLRNLEGYLVDLTSSMRAPERDWPVLSPTKAWDLLDRGHILDAPDLRRSIEVEEHLDKLYNSSIPDLLRTVRGVFHHRHITSHLADDLPDRNLRYRPASQQLIDVVGMVASYVTEVLLGDGRAAVVAIGESPFPRVACDADIVRVDLDAGVLGCPVLLETIGHEVAHQLVGELTDGTSWSSWRRKLDLSHRSSTFSRAWGSDSPVFPPLRAAWEEFEGMVYFGECSDERIQEALADFVEYKLWGYRDDREWIRSFTFRQLSAMPPVWHPPDVWSSDSASRPQWKPDDAEAAVERLVFARTLITIRKRTDIGSVRSELLSLLPALNHSSWLKPGPSLHSCLLDSDRWNSSVVSPLIDQAAWLFDPETIRVTKRLLLAIETFLARRRLEVTEWNLFPRAFAGLRQAFFSASTPCRLLSAEGSDGFFVARSNGKQPERSSWLLGDGLRIRGQADDTARARAYNCWLGRLLVLLPTWRERLLKDFDRVN